MPMFVDLQGFKGKENDFIVKELAVLSPVGLVHYIFTPPYKRSLLSSTQIKEVIWLKSNHHGLDWNDGFIPYYKAGALLRNAIGDGTVYVKGFEKIQWIQRLVNARPVIINVENIDCDVRFSDKMVDCLPCLNHRGVCALKNVFMLRKWYTDIYK